MTTDINTKKLQPRRWSSEMEEDLLAMVKKGWDDEKIATELGRTVGAQIIRRKQIAARLLAADDPPTEDDVLKRCKITEEDLQDQKERDSKNPGKKKKRMNSKEELILVAARISEIANGL
jgi:hypothetical protein